MKLTVATVAALAVLGASAAHAQDDDWEFAEDPAQQLSVAAVRYDAGVAIIVQCRAGGLTAVMAGVPEATTELVLTAARADGRTDIQTWQPAGAPGALRSTVPARDIRFMRGGGAYTVRTLNGATASFGTTFDLPPQSLNLDRVLTACGWALTDDRDQLQRAGSGISLTDPDDTLTRSPRSGSRPRAGGGDRPARPEPSPAGPVLSPAEGQISCVIRDMRLTECRKDHPPTAASAAPPVVRLLRQMEGLRVFAPQDEVTEGRVIYPGGALIRVTRERLL